MPPAVKMLFLLILILLQSFVNIWLKSSGRLTKSKQTKKVKVFASTVPNRKLLGKDMLQIVGDYLDPESVQKMRRSSRQWRNVNVYENVAPNGHEMAVFKHKNTDEILWEASACKNFSRTTVPNQNKLVNALRQNDKKKWGAVFDWVVQNFYAGGHPYGIRKSKDNVYIFLKRVMLAIAENIDTEYSINNYRAFSIHPLVLASIMNDADSILKLLRRGANANQMLESFFRYPLHFAAVHGNVKACVALLDHSADINVRSTWNRTPLMMAAYEGHENVMKLLMKRGADRALTEAHGRTALKIALEYKRSKCAAILQHKKIKSR